MAKVPFYVEAFVSGELAPIMFGRVGLASYAKSAAKLRNVYVTPQGGAFRREGLALAAETTTSQAGRLVSFEFNADQVYNIHFTPGQMKVYRQVAGVDTLQATVSTAPIDLLTAGVLAAMTWTQSADTLILFHADVKTIEITRSSHTAWTAAHISFTNIPTYDFGSGAEATISATRGWPRCGGFSDGRLWLAGLKQRPQTMLGSTVGEFYDLDVGTGLDDECIDVTIANDRVNAILHLFPGRTLQIFTTGGEFVIQSALGDPVTPGKIPTQLKKMTLHGSNDSRPVSVDGATIFVERGGHVVRQFVFSDLEQSYNAPNISLLSPHLIDNPLRLDVRRATEDFAADYVYAVNADGTMAVLNILRDEQLLAWSLFETDGLFEDVSVVGNDVYVVVKRDIEGVVKRFIERLNPDHFMDCSVRTDRGLTGGPIGLLLSLTVNNTSTAWSGLSHLNGETVKVRGDGFVLNDEVVSGGAIVSSKAVTELEAGLNFAALIKTMPAVVEIQGKLTVGDYTRLVSANFLLHESRNVVVKANDSETEYKPPFSFFGSNVLDAPVPVFNGWKEVFLAGFSRQSQVTITQEEPLEFGVLAVKVEMEI